MPRSRLITLMLVCCVLAVVLVWAWLQRDALATGIARSLVGDLQVEWIQGVRIAPGKLEIERISARLAGGTPVELKRITISQPLRLLFQGGEEGAQVAIHTVRVGPRPETRPGGRIALSDLLEATRHLPQRVAIANLVGADKQPGPVRILLLRDEVTGSVSLLVSGPELRLRGKITRHDATRGQPSPVELVARLENGENQAVMSLGGRFRPVLSATTGDPPVDHWDTSLNLTIDAERLAGALPLLPLPARLGSPILSTDRNNNNGPSTGTVQISFTGLVPDNLARAGDYENLQAYIESDRFALNLAALPGQLPLQMTLVTDKPVKLDLASLRPLGVSGAQGAATIRLVPLEAPGQEVFSGTIQTRGPERKPEIEARGTLDLAAAAPLMGDPAPALGKLQALGKLGISDLNGELHLLASAALPPLDTLSDDKFMTGLTVELLPGSRPTAVISPTGKSPPALVNTLEALDTSRTQLQVTLQEPVTLRADQWPGPAQVETSGLQLILADTSGTQQLAATLDSMSCQVGQDTGCFVSLVMRAPRLTSAGDTSLSDTQVSFKGNVAFSDGTYKVESEQLMASTASFTNGEIQATNVQVESSDLSCSAQSARGLHCEGDLNTTIVSFDAGTVAGGGSMALRGFELKRARDKLQGSGGYATDDWTIKILDEYLAFTEVQGKFTLDEQVLKGHSRVRAGHVGAEGTWNHNLAEGRGSATFRMPQANFSRDKPLSNAVTGLPVELVAGTISGAATISWPARDSDRLEGQLRDVAAIYDKAFAVGISGDAELRRQQQGWYTARPQAFTAERADVGVPVEDIAFALSLEQSGDLVLADFSARLLGGAVSSEALTWNLEGKERRSQVTFSGLSLKALSDQVEAGNFAASGTIDMTIPLVTREGSVTVKQGKVVARPPGGRLRYYGAFSPEMLAGNPQLKMLSGALEDYSYRTLSGTLEYPPSGDMQMQLKLVGRSASVDEKRDLIINLNLENNIPAMLRSLQASRDLTEALERQLETQ